MDWPNDDDLMELETKIYDLEKKLEKHIEEPKSLIAFIYEYFKDKKVGSYIYQSVKNDILERKTEEDPRLICEVEVSLRSLGEKYPLVKHKILIKVIVNLYKDNLFDGGDINKLFFIYYGRGI